MVGTFNGLILIDNYDSVEVSGADLDRAIGAEQTSSSTAEFFKKLFLGVCDLTRLIWYQATCLIGSLTCCTCSLPVSLHL